MIGVTMMDVNVLRSVVTVAGLVLFAALVAWVWWPARRTMFEAAARAPFDGDAEARDE